jgi:hypothetical protein
MKLAGKSALTLTALLAGTSAALAESPLGQWNITFFNEPSLSPSGSNDVCFKADHTWYSPSSPSYKGSWFGEGDELRWYGTGSTAITTTTTSSARTL